MIALSLRIYSACWWLALPLVLFRLWWRGRKEAGYRQHISERLSLSNADFSSPLIWVHAVSVGETRAAEPLIHALLKKYPQHHVLLTHMTPTGRATGAALFHNEPRISQSYIPYDALSLTQRFISKINPSICVLMETEVWPSLIDSCSKAGIPIALINARLSARSLKRAQWFDGLLGDALRKITVVIAQTQGDAERLHALGARTIIVAGSLKFDITPPEAMLAMGNQWRQQIGDRLVLLCASTREGEEALLLDAYMAATLDPRVLVIMVPRHPQRFDEVERMLEARGLRWQRRSQLTTEHVPASTQILLGDTMGEMFAYYAACDVAFIGGSLLPLGGQNLIEALSCGKPVLVGPHTFNFKQVTVDAITVGAAIRVPDAQHIFSRLSELDAQSRDYQVMSDLAIQFCVQHQGATARTLKLLSPQLK
jgi:3-deoxy-D-manno-octulosonic-acid transferase